MSGPDLGTGCLGANNYSVRGGLACEVHNFPFAQKVYWMSLLWLARIGFLGFNFVTPQRKTFEIPAVDSALRIPPSSGRFPTIMNCWTCNRTGDVTRNVVRVQAGGALHR